MGESRIDAADIFDWNCLSEIAEYQELHEVKTFAVAVRLFAYAFTATARVDD